jgi:hypothetical protein
MFQALFKADMLPIPLKHLHSLCITYSSPDNVDCDVYRTIVLFMQGMPERDMFIDSKHIPEERCFNLFLFLFLSLMHMTTWIHILKYGL